MPRFSSFSGGGFLDIANLALLYMISYGMFLHGTGGNEVDDAMPTTTPEEAVPNGMSSESTTT